MRTTIRELMERVDNIDKVIDELRRVGSPAACTLDLAAEYLEEYIDLLKDAKVDI